MPDPSRAPRTSTHIAGNDRDWDNMRLVSTCTNASRIIDFRWSCLLPADVILSRNLDDEERLPPHRDKQLVLPVATTAWTVELLTRRRTRFATVSYVTLSTRARARCNDTRALRAALIRSLFACLQRKRCRRQLPKTIVLTELRCRRT